VSVSDQSILSEQSAKFSYATHAQLDQRRKTESVRSAAAPAYRRRNTGFDEAAQELRAPFAQRYGEPQTPYPQGRRGVGRGQRADQRMHQVSDPKLVVALGAVCR